MTLIELLVVIIIMTTIVAAAIPLLSPSNDDRRLREASRGLNTYITGAQARAISLHRPYGIAIKRLSQDTNKNGQRPEDRGVCLEVFYVEQQPPYSGFDVNSRACVAIHPTISGYVLVRFVTRGTATAGLPVGWTADQFPPRMIRPGDVVEINGTQFELLFIENEPLHNIQLDDDSKTYFETANKNRPPQILARPLNDSGQQINSKYDDMGREIGSVVQAQSPYWANPAPYKILRQATPASDEPYQLPEGTAIDLRASGVGPDNYFFVPGYNDNDDGVLIMFTPEGRVARVSYSQLPINNADNSIDQNADFDQPVVNNVFLLIGRRDRIPAPAVGGSGGDPTLNSSTFSPPKTDEEMQKLKEPINWLSGSSRWIVIGSQSGRVATIENATVDLAGVLSNPMQPFQAAAQSTEEMRAAQILAAREFTHEMGQLGGR